MLSLIRQIWVENPDLRLGQLLVNASTRFEKLTFYCEDDELEKALIAFQDIIKRYG